MSDARRLAEGYAAWFKAVELGAAVRGDVIDSLARTLAREAPTQPAAVPDVVREALEAAIEYMTFRSTPHSHPYPADQCRAALDEQSAEEAQSFGFVAMNHGTVLTERPFSSAEIARLEHPNALRIVKLVAVEPQP